MKCAAIDIGSNAIRLLFTRVFVFDREAFFKKDPLFRLCLWLGEDVCEDQTISEGKINRLVHTLIAFKRLIEAYRPVDFMSCAKNRETKPYTFRKTSPPAS